MTAHASIRDDIVRIGASLFSRGLTHGSTGNISVRLDASGRHIAGDAATKEAFLHTTMYAERPASGAVVHLHSHHSVAVSCLQGLDPANVLPPITAYSVMRVGALALAPYFPPGDEKLAAAVGALAGKHHAILLANHGPVVAGATLGAATDAIEELEETARLFLLLRREAINPLTLDQVTELNRRFPT